MRKVMLATIAATALACGGKKQEISLAKAAHTVSAQDTAFIRANCDMPDSVLAGTRPCIDRVQSLKVRVF